MAEIDRLKDLNDRFGLSESLRIAAVVTAIQKPVEKASVRSGSIEIVRVYHNGPERNRCQKTAEKPWRFCAVRVDKSVSSAHRTKTGFQRGVNGLPTPHRQSTFC
jgi:hypothetical protein